jgi:tetratricopeptide (TPR) repeat protein
VEPDTLIGRWWRTAVIALAGSLAYLNSVSTPFLFDDMASVVDNERIRDISHWGNFWSTLNPGPNSPVSARPLVNLSFAINYAIGGLNVFGYHVWNIAVHVLCGIVLFALIRRTLALPGLPPALGRRTHNLAFAAALIWTLHPLNTEVVDYVTQRSESMMALFYLLTLYASVRATGPWPFVAVVSCLLGTACKESMVTAPVMVVLFDRLFVFGSLRKAWRARWRLYLGLASTWGLLGVLSIGPRSRLSGILTGVSPWTYLLNQAPILARYLRLAVWPRSLVLLYGWPREITLREVLPSAVFIATLLALTVWLLRFRPRLAFLGACCWITLAPTSSIVPMVTEVAAERRMYLPLAAFAVLSVVGVQLLWDILIEKMPARMRKPRLAAIGAAGLLAAVSTALAAATLTRNLEFSSPLAMARTVLDRYPTPIAHQMLGITLLEAGRRQEAMTELRKALPTAPRAHYFLGVELLRDGQVAEGIAELQALVREQPPYSADVVDAHGYLGTAFANQEHWPEAIAEFRAILQAAPGDPTAELFLANALFATSQWDKAIFQYDAYLATDPNNEGALNNLGVALASSGRIEAAIVIFRRVLAIDPTDAEAERNLATAVAATTDPGR